MKLPIYKDSFLAKTYPLFYLILLQKSIFQTKGIKNGISMPDYLKQ